MSRRRRATPSPARVPSPPAPVPRRRAAVIVLLVVGALLTVALPMTAGGRRINAGVGRWVAIGIAVLLALAPAVRDRVAVALDRVRSPSPRGRRIAALAVAAVACLYLYATALNQDRDLFPKTPDECSYLIQMRTFAAGHLAMPTLPLPDFFDSFYLLTQPAYASIYFPGTAAMYLPALWLGLPTWMLPLLAAGAVVGLVYRIVTELLDGAAGALAALLMLSLTWFRMLSIMLMSQTPLLLLGLVMIWAWLRWRRSARVGWLALIGAAAGWAAITRPVDALCFALPVGLAVLSSLRRQPARRALLGLAALLVTALPFLALQLQVDRAVTGRALRTPFGLYADRDYPGTAFGFHRYDPAARPASPLLQKQIYYRQVVAPLVEAHQPARLPGAWLGRWFPTIADATLPARLLLIFVPAGLLGLAARRRWPLLATLPMFVAGYVCYTFFLEHYTVVVAPAMLLLVLLGFRSVEEAWPEHRAAVASASSVLIVAIAVTSLWEFNRSVDDEPFHSDALRTLHGITPEQLGGPAVILFRFDPNNPAAVARVAEDPVYNTDTPWPDDAPVVRARDLPGREPEIRRYYATHGPPRHFWRFEQVDAKTYSLTPLDN